MTASGRMSSVAALTCAALYHTDADRPKAVKKSLSVWAIQRFASRFHMKSRSKSVPIAAHALAQ